MLGKERGDGCSRSDGVDGDIMSQGHSAKGANKTNELSNEFCIRLRERRIGGREQMSVMEGGGEELTANLQALYTGNECSGEYAVALDTITMLPPSPLPRAPAASRYCLLIELTAIFTTFIVPTRFTSNTPLSG